MEINILQQLEGARQAKGLTVIIDVFRAMTVEAYLLHNGAAFLYATADKEEAYSYREKHPGTILIGERRGIMLPGFDYGNSPSQVRKADFTGRTVVHTTSAGTQGIDAAVDAEEILTGALVNAKATADYILRKNPEKVSLVCMGLDAVVPTEEDTLCAEYIKSLLEGRPIDPSEQFDLVARTSGAKFFDPANAEVFPREDFFLSLDPDRFSFVIRAEKASNGMRQMIRVRT